MTLQMVTCPLCCQPGFNTSDALCSALISASTRKLFCPVCNETLIGLDKLTIHLFGHNSSIKNFTKASAVSNSACQSKILVTAHSREDESSVVAPVLYIQSENGQLFALAPTSLVNQLGAVTINTQNYISNTSVCENKLVGSQNSTSMGKHLETPQFSSCKDLLTSGDFSEPFDDAADSEASCFTNIDDFPTDETKSHRTAAAPENPQVDDIQHESPSSSVLDARHPPFDEGTTVETSPKALIPCNICEMGFSNKAILAVHKQLMHKNCELSEEQSGTQRSLEKSRKKPLTCSWCPSTFNLKSSLMIHVKVTHPAQKESFERKEAEKLACPVCGKSFPKESTLNQHMKAAHGEKPWQCVVCSKSFTTKYFLRKHKRIHTGETPYECAICHKVFTFQQSYHKHMLYHTDDKPYCCSHCGRLFKELSTLNNHERIHSGEKPFACETCGKCFRQRVSYLVHRRIHTGAMPYKCTACNKSFRYKISQRTHKCPEHPPGVVVKTLCTLVDRLQAVINLGESGGEDQMKYLDSGSHATVSGVGDLVHPSTSTLNFQFPTGQSEAQVGDDKTNSASETIVASHSQSGEVPSSSDFNTSCSSQTALIPPIFNGEQGSKPGISHDQTLPGVFNCNEITMAEKSRQQFPGEVDVFSMNLDSSPSECLGKLHISSDEYYNQTIVFEHTTKSQAIPHPNLSFDNMEDMDLCNLFF